MVLLIIFIQIVNLNLNLNLLNYFLFEIAFYNMNYENALILINL